MKNKYWRLLSIFLLLIWAFMIISNLYLTVIEEKSYGIRLLESIVYGFCSIIFIVLVVFPKNFLLYSLVCCFLGIQSIVAGVSIEAFLIYLIGCVFAYFSGILQKNSFIKVCYVCLPLIALMFQYRFGAAVLINSIADLLFLCVSSVYAYFLFKEYELRKNKVNSTDALSNDFSQSDPYSLSEYECNLIKDVLADKTFLAIGKERFKSESAIKKQMVCVYRKLGIKTKHELFELQRKRQLDFLKAK